jgi:hypothetical protein
MIQFQDMLAQSPGSDVSDFLYIIVALIVTVLSSLGGWIRKKFGKEESPGAEDEPVYEVTMGEGDELVLRPADGKRTGQTGPVAGAPTTRPVMRPSAPRPQTASPTSRTAPETRAPAHTYPAPLPQPASASAPIPRRHEGIEPRRVEPRRHPAQQAPARPTRKHASRAAGALSPESPGDERDHHAFHDEPSQKKSVRAASAGRELVLNEPLTRQALRRAVVLSEILSPPLALRDYDQSPFSRRND